MAVIKFMINVKDIMRDKETADWEAGCVREKRRDGWTNGVRFYLRSQPARNNVSLSLINCHMQALEGYQCAKNLNLFLSSGQ